MGFNVMSQKYHGIMLCATLPPVGRRSLRAAISLQGQFERPHHLNSFHRTGTEEHATRRGNLMGLPSETMRRMVPSKWLLIHLIAAWKNASRQGPGSQCYL
jgi:hypothetical protein